MINWELELNLYNQTRENYQEHLRFPLYINQYCEAIRIIFFKIIREEYEIEKQKERKNNFKNAGKKDVSNIMSFIGERGSGKTTAMGEFCQILESLNNEKELRWWISQTLPETELQRKISEHSFFFKTMDPIDASCLEKKEDLFEIIITNIYHEFEKTVKMEYGGNFSEDVVYKHKVILDKFRRIMDGYYAVRNAQKEEFSDSVIARMKWMSRSFEIKKDIDDLLDELFKVWSTTKEERFLVVAVDDLDLNVVGGYEMLDQLHKYFSNPHIIITIAVDFEQMNRICEMHYMREFSPQGRIAEGELGNSMAKHCRRLSGDYIIKTLPINNRVFMPDVKKMGSKVVIEEGGQLILTKNFVLKKIGRMMHIYYDSQGTKIHFCEPQSIREIVTFNQFLDSMYEVNFEVVNNALIPVEEQRRLMDLYMQNHERFNEDIIKRRVKDGLSDDYSQIFHVLYERDVARRAMYFCKMAEGRIRDKNVQLELPKDYEESTYNYALLLKTIYDLGRVSAEDKEFIKCILASFTTEMVREQYCAIYHEKQEERNRAVNRLLSFIGQTFGGEWTQYLVPYINGRYPVAYNQEAELTWAELRIPDPGREIFEGLMDERPIMNANDAKIRLTLFEQWLEEQKVIPTMEILSSYFSVIVENSGIKFMVYMDSQRGVITIGGAGVKARLDIFGFVRESLKYKENCQNLEDMIARAFASQLIDEIGSCREKKYLDSAEWKKECDLLETSVRKIIRKQSLYNKIKWNYEGRAALPFYDLDLTYNVVKRLRKKILKENPEKINAGECYESIKGVYEALGRCLENQRKVYDNVGYIYDKIYREYPFVKAFLDYKRYLNSQFPTILADFIYKSQSPYHLQLVDYPTEDEE